MPQSREYREARERAHIMGQEFPEKLDRLDPSLRCDYVKFTDAENDADHYEFYQNFVIGFRLATQIVMTIFIEK